MRPLSQRSLPCGRHRRQRYENSLLPPLSYIGTPGIVIGFPLVPPLAEPEGIVQYNPEIKKVLLRPDVKAAAIGMRNLFCALQDHLKKLSGSLSIDIAIPRSIICLSLSLAVSSAAVFSERVSFITPKAFDSLLNSRITE